jgi:hypothetical protein
LSAPIGARQALGRLIRWTARIVGARLRRENPAPIDVVEFRLSGRIVRISIGGAAHSIKNTPAARDGFCLPVIGRVRAPLEESRRAEKWPEARGNAYK